MNGTKILVKSLLLSNNFWVVNKDIVSLFGLETAFLLGVLAEGENMKTDDEGWFYQTTDMLEKITTLSRHKQDQAIKKLEEAGVLTKELRGIPAKRYFKLNYNSLANKIVNFQQTCL